MNAGDVSLACARILADELRRQGVDAVCISPGSRSTPLALAFARDGRFKIFVHLDERSSAFFALGRAKATGRPAALVCTSGTAAANYLPAVVEASQSRIPMIVLTADRPAGLRGTGANQTIDQHNLYGVYPRLFEEAPLPSAAAGAARAWRALAVRAVTAAIGGPAGPAHLNLPFPEPLTPSGEDAELRDEVDHPIVERQQARTNASDVNRLAALIAGVERGVILAGGMNQVAPAICDLAAAAGWPLLAEPHSNLRTPGRALSAPQALVGNQSFMSAHAPEVVLQFGAAPTTRASLALAAGAPRLITVDGDGWPADPARHAERIVRADPDHVARAVVAKLQPRASGWLSEWLSADALARRALDSFLDACDEPFEPRIARDVAAGLPDGSVLFVGNSTPIRDLDATMAPRNGIRVLANRGASGIDGIVSTVLGIASARAPVTALIGDLTLLHDAGALLWNGADAARFVVIDNGGGGIFDLLPSGNLPENEQLFVAPPRPSVAEIWERFVDRRPVDRARQRALRADLAAAVDAAIG